MGGRTPAVAALSTPGFGGPDGSRDRRERASHRDCPLRRPRARGRLGRGAFEGVPCVNNGPGTRTGSAQRNRRRANVFDSRFIHQGMPLYMDTHRKVKGVTAAAVAEAHAKDLKVQGKHGVNYRSYWVDEKTETIFCLVDAPSPEAAARVHKEAHGLVADEIHEVHQG
jgi:Nickel responsive protein SCO4226-like